MGAASVTSASSALLCQVLGFVLVLVFFFCLCCAVVSTQVPAPSPHGGLFQ